MASQRETKQPGRGDRAVRRHGACWPRDVCLAAARTVVEQGLAGSEVSARYAEPIPSRQLLLTKLEQALRPLA